MKFICKNTLTWQLQAFVWVLVYLLSILSHLPFNSFLPSVVYATFSILFYAMIIYANAQWLIPSYYYKKKFVTYTLLALALICIAVIFRDLLGLYVFNRFFTSVPERLSIKTFAYLFFSGFLIYIFSVFYRITLDYLLLNKKQEELKLEKMRSELNWLKQQLQPHFIFNTLNNIYYITQRESPEGADLLGRLSSIIRYFYEESRKDIVFLEDEIQLLHSYIELEKLRMRYEVELEFYIEGNLENVVIPPLLLMPVVENIFKHGVDRNRADNFVFIRLQISESRLSFVTINRIVEEKQISNKYSTGLENLEKRLSLYYPHNYILTCSGAGTTFTVLLEIPLNEN